MSSVIVRSDSALSVAISGDAVALKTSALETAALVGRVTTPDEQKTAVAAQIELRRVLKLCEDSRKEVKEPVLDYGRKIDTIAKQFAEELREEELRIVQLVADFQALEQAKVRAAEAAKRLEEERLERERQAELQRIRDEEAAKQRKLDEEAARIAREAAAAKSAKAKAEAEVQRLELERQRSLAAAESHAQLDAANERHCEQVAALPTVTAARAEGQIVKFDWEIVCNDLWALARSHPLCVKLEPRLNEIKALLDAGVKVNGVTAKKVPKSSVRLTPQLKAIDV